MKSFPLILALAVSFGLTGRESPRLLAQGCDSRANCREFCKEGRRASCACCDDKGLLDVLEKATCKLDSKLSKTLAGFAAAVRPSPCAGGCDSACDSLGTASCQHCSQHHAHDHAAQPDGIIQAPHTHAVPAPPVDSRILHGAPELVPPTDGQSELVVPHEIPVPAPMNAPQMNDAKIDPFRDDSARSGSSRHMQSKSMVRARPATSGERVTFRESEPAQYFSVNRLSSTAGHRSISDAANSTDYSGVSLSSGSSRRKHAATASLSDIVSNPARPVSDSNVVQASAVMPAHATMADIIPAKYVSQTQSLPEPINPLRSR